MTIATPQKPKLANLSIKIDATDRDRLKSIAIAKNRTTHYLMKEAIQKYIAAEEAEQRAIDAAIRSMEHFKKTGLHTTLDEMKAWAKAIKLDRNTPMPSCHT
jgi:predicted transcriptional regulator